jgi:hypothetical protein
MWSLAFLLSFYIFHKMTDKNNEEVLMSRNSAEA